MIQAKKDAEKNILDKFLIKQNQKFSILSEEHAQKVDSKYNGENPDFIISDGTGYIGVELFRLILRNTARVNSPFVNLAHRQTRFPKEIKNLDADSRAHINALKQYGLAKQDHITDVLMQEIPDKVSKLSSYCTNKVWLLGYADEVAYQKGIVENIRENCLEEALRKEIFSKIHIPERIERIILFETGTSFNDHIFYLK